MILSFRTERSGQTMQTPIRLLPEKQSDKGLHCLLFRLHRLGAALFGNPSCSNFRVITANILGVRIFRIFTVHPSYILDIPICQCSGCLLLSDFTEIDLDIR